MKNLQELSNFSPYVKNKRWSIRVVFSLLWFVFLLHKSQWKSYKRRSCWYMEFFIQGNESFIYGVIHTRKWVVHIRKWVIHLCKYTRNIWRRKWVIHIQWHELSIEGNELFIHDTSLMHIWTSHILTWMNNSLCSKIEKNQGRTYVGKSLGAKISG